MKLLTKNNMEIWKDIPCYEGIYQVSNLGRFRSLDRVVDYGVKKALRKGRILNLKPCRNGYLYTVISVNNKRKTIKPHRVVCEVFNENTYNKTCVNHINGIKSDNRAENLEWCTYKENTKHAYNNGLKKGVKGEESHLSKLTKKDVDYIRYRYSIKNITQKELSMIFKVSQSQIQRILSNKNW